MIDVVLLIAFLITAALLFKPVKGALLGALDDRSRKIRDELDGARQLHQDAKALLEKYQRQLAEGEKLAAEIRAHAEAERDRLETRLRQELEAALERRTEQAVERIAQEERQAVQEFRARVADVAVRSTRRLLTDKLGPEQGQKLIAGAIEDVGRKLA